MPDQDANSTAGTDDRPSWDLYRRMAESTLITALADTPVVFIHGPRQCGKTTLAITGLALVSVSQMGIFTQGIKLPNVASVQGPHDADAGQTLSARRASRPGSRLPLPPAIPASCARASEDL